MTPAVFGPEWESRMVRGFLPKKGFFVDVGANEPVHNSQTYALERDGWSGVLVEPLPDCAARLREQRVAAVFNVACGSREQHGRHYFMSNDGPHSSIDRGELSIVVLVQTLDSVIEKAGLAQVDFVSIDVEGFEIDVLKGFSLLYWKPKLLLIEDHVTDWSIHLYLRRHGYKLVRRTGVNAWYVPDETFFYVSLFGRWQLFRKYVIGLPIRKLRHFVIMCRKKPKAAIPPV